MKSGVSLIIPAGLLLFLNSAEAGIFLKAKDPFIIQEAVWLYSNSTAITSIAPDVSANRFSNTVSPLYNVPEAYVYGTKGVLYNREESCSPDTIEQPVPIPFYADSAKSSKVPKIALIKKQGGPCSLVEKIKNAQKESAIGVIIYDISEMTYADQDYKAGVPPDSEITIPVYYVDHKIGLALYYQLQKMAGVPVATIATWDSSHLTTRISVMVSLMPSDNTKATAWELTLLVMLILLGTSIVFSVAMHFYMWKRNKRLQITMERSRTTAAAVASLPMGKALLSIARLYQFPTRTIDTTLNEEERKKVETVLSDEKKKEALIKSTALKPTVEPRKSKFKFGKKTKRPDSIASIAIKIDTPVNNMCVICLEAFKIGDEVRELPCHHEYHTICIDPWLTSKSCECPLCKFDCSDSKSEETIADPDGLMAAAAVPGLRGMVLRPYLRFKANRRRRAGQVGVTTDVEQQVRRPSRVSTMVPPPSPGLLAAVRAIEAIETPITTSAEIDEHYQAYEEAQNNNNHDQEESEQDEDFTSIALSQPRQSTVTERSETTQNQQIYEESSSQPRYSVSSYHDDAGTVHTVLTTTGASVSTYAPTSDGGPLPDIDVSSISLCSIDLGGLSEDFHNTFNNHR
ncbi:hypothetical protein BDF21DRAFT_403177 [Thamnidium elegans]|nr:hypothetical protein BDF21DRAFT_403177 [Thamnidium elegans]